MTSKEFVETVKRQVINSAIADVMSNLQNPRGRRVSSEERACSDWYNNLPDSDVAHVSSIISSVAHASVFGLFAAFDGVRKILEEQGKFELFFDGKKRTLLNDPRLIGLHELLNALP